MNSFLKAASILAVTALFMIPATAQDEAKSDPKRKAETVEPIVKPTPVKSGESGNPSIRMFKGELEVDFPDVEGWERSDPYRYPKGLGYSVQYDSIRGGRVTVYVYNGGRKKIANDLSGTVKDEMDRAKGEIYATEEAGYYENVKELTSDTITLGGAGGKLKALRAVFTLDDKRSNMVGVNKSRTSEIYIFPHQNHFIKIRSTRSKEDGKTPNEAIAALFTEIDGFFTK